MKKPKPPKQGPDMAGVRASGTTTARRSKSPHHRGVGGPKRKDPNRCIRDHDLTVPENVFVDAIGARHCRLCRAEREARTAELKRTAGVQRKYRFSECVECGKAKYPDRRRMCFTCLHDVAMERPALVDAKLDRAVAAEDLLPWERNKHAQDTDRSGARTERPQDGGPS